MSPASLLYIEHLYGADCITETVFGLEFSISPRAHFAINTYGAEILFETISQILGTVKGGISKHLKMFRVMLKIILRKIFPVFFCRNHGTKNSTSCFKT
jgi:hypothetical protein